MSSTSGSICDSSASVLLDLPHINFDNGSLVVKSAIQTVDAKGRSSYKITYERPKSGPTTEDVSERCKVVSSNGTSAMPPPVITSRINRKRPTGKRTGGAEGLVTESVVEPPTATVVIPTNNILPPAPPKASKRQATQDALTFRSIQLAKETQPVKAKSVRSTSRQRRHDRREKERETLSNNPKT